MPPPPKPAGPAPGRAALHEAALRHLSRFAATEAGLVRVLDRRVQRWARAAAVEGDGDAIGAAAAAARAAVRAVARALVEAGVIDDHAFAVARAARLQRAGRSRRAASAHLAAKGVAGAVTAAALGDADELPSALAYARRRRLGPFRPAADDETRLRDMAALARAGFPRPVVERALACDPAEAAAMVAALKRGVSVLPPTTAPRPSFTRAAVMEGVRQVMPMQVALVPFGLVCGILAQGQGLSLLEATLMSALCYAGSAQLLVLGHWPAPVLAAGLAAFVMNLRMALMGPVIAPWLDRLRGVRLWASLFVMADQNWAMSVREMQAGRWDAGFLFGSGAAMWVVWTAGTAAGHVMGATMRPPPGHPLFFTALAVFVAIIASMWRGRRDLMPWIVAAAVSLVLSRLLEGTWYIVAGALAGAAAGVLRDRRA